MTPEEIKNNLVTPPLDDKQKQLSDSEEEKLVNDAFQKLIDTYIASNHRKKVDIITRAFNMAKVAHQGVRRRK